MVSCCTIPIFISETDFEVPISVFDSEPVEIEIDATGYPVYPDTYTGTCNVVPKQVKQVLKTKGLTMLDDVTVEEIPNYYGLITWNGSFLRVS